MKLNKLFLGAIAALASAAMVACSDDAPDVNNGGENGDDVRYLAVSIVPTPTMGSRAGGEQDNGDPNNALYEDGYANENTVNSVRFYFFDEGGNPAAVKRNSTVNYYDVPAADLNPSTTITGSTTNPGAPDIEKQLEAILIIETSEGDKLPGQILAVINPDASLNLGTSSLDLPTLRNKVANFASLANNNTFVMANSVYANGAEVMRATKVPTNCYQLTAALAKENPIDIYVERNVAKVRAQYAGTLSATMNANGGLIPAMTKPVTDDAGNVTTQSEEIKVGDTKVYIKINGWNVTNTLSQANLSKHIDANWIGNNNLIGTNIQWNWAPYFRSFWAKQNFGISTDQTLVSYNNINKVFGSTNNSNIVYVNENAAKDGTPAVKKNTQIIVSATLCDADENELNVVDYFGQKFVDVEALTTLKGLIRQSLASNGHTIIDADKNPITDADIDFTSVEGEAYSAKAILSTTGKAKTWYNGTVADDKVVSETTLNGYLAALPSALIWKNGQSYYYSDIQHFGTFGVVRNHIYDITAVNFYGLGTPVLDPNTPIEPDKPQYSESFLAARINILSWRVVSSNVTFD